MNSKWKAQESELAKRVGLHESIQTMGATLRSPQTIALRYTKMLQVRDDAAIFKALSSQRVVSRLVCVDPSNSDPLFQQSS